MWIDMRVGFSNDMVIVEPKGRITLETQQQFSDAIRELLRENLTKLVLNLQYVPYIDSAGLGAIVYAYTSATSRGGTLKLLGVGARNRRLLAATRLLTVFKIFETEEDVLSSFGSDARNLMAS